MAPSQCVTVGVEGVGTQMRMEMVSLQVVKGRGKQAPRHLE